MPDSHLIEQHLAPLSGAITMSGVSDVFLSDDGTARYVRKKEMLSADTSQWGRQQFWDLLTMMDIPHDTTALLPRDRAWSGIIELGNVRLRYCCLGHNQGTRMNLRVLPEHIPAPPEIGLKPAIVRKFLEIEQGLVLVCGATGQGKSTTIASLVQQRANEREENIVTLEDPIEFVYNSGGCLFTQRQLGRDFSSFAQGLKETLRFAPNVIVVGEIRDMETAEIALQAAETGHVVVATLHTTGCADTVRRYLQLVAQERLAGHRDTLADALQITITQRLIRRDGNIRAVREIMVKTPGVAQHIRNGDFHLLNQDIETGAKYGMCFYPEGDELEQGRVI